MLIEVPQRNMGSRLLDFEVLEATSITDAKFDCLIVVNDSTTLPKPLSSLQAIIDEYSQTDKSLSDANKAHLIVISKSTLPSGRLVFGNTGSVNRDFDDVRRFADAGLTAMKRALESGARKPLVWLPEHPKYPNAPLATLLSVFHGAYVPLEVRESRPENAKKVDLIGVIGHSPSALSKTVDVACAIEAGRVVQRDILGSDPVRMAPQKAAEYVQKTFDGNSGVKVQVTSDQEVIEKEFPLTAAVTRAVKGMPKYSARIVELTYEGQGPIEETLFFVGKGVTLDTGGLDVKYDGHMYGMSRDKGGAATVVGIFKVLSVLKPKGLKVFGICPFVRNATGSDAYSCDEIIKSRSGKRVKIVNTDAEGRLIMVDTLCYAKEKALSEVNSHLFTVATLTGHAVLAVGDGYTIIIDNGPAKALNNAQHVQERAEAIGDCFEISTLRREDYVMIAAKSEYEDLVQSNTQPSARTPRGHQFPAAFLIRGSGLDEHGLDSKHPLKYSHIDMAPCDGPYPDVPFGWPVPGIVAAYVLPRI